ncbi:MAG: hypothetical protein CVU74_03300 [Deltaproteobacteria bacterium HGW-Deltaproteobacteria-9]|nr:MAG: hypothetical protein CVU74_03300 [Deltaproteobacteria bacterium HGW-Deltaproteobacteria-9]
MLQLLDKEAQCGELLRHVFKFAGLRHDLGFGEVPDGGGAFGQYIDRPALAKYGQGALNLTNRLLQRRQCRLTRRIAEERIQGLLDGTEIGAYLARHGFDQQAFLSLARHGVEMWQLQRGQGFATRERIEATADDIRELRKVGIQGGKIVERGFCQEQCRRHFQGQRLVMARGVTA